MKKQHTNFKKILEKNAKTTIKKYLESNLENLKSLFINFINNLKTDLKNNNNLSFTVDRIEDFSRILEERGNLTKFNYHFPDVLNVGELISLQKMISPIIGEYNSKDKVPFFIPTQKSNLALLLNPKTQENIITILETIVIKMLLSLPDGLVKVSIFDKSGVGQNFPNLTGLHDKFTNAKILSEDNAIELELENIRNSMTTISKAITSNGYDSIEDYNNNTDEISQRYQFIVIHGFPTGFNKRATENILSLIESGSKAGIYVFMTVNSDPIQGLNKQINSTPLKTILANTSTFEFPDRINEAQNLGLVQENVECIMLPLKNEKELKVLFNTKFYTKFDKFRKNEAEFFISELNQKIKPIILQPIIDIKKVLPNKDKFWQKKAGKGISVPFAKKGIENVYCSLGVNEFGESIGAHHLMVGGATGSGKTVLLHDIILMAGVHYSPKELQFWLLDYKEGTEFAVYKNYPYVQVLSMESEIEFGHEVLDKAIEEMKKRGKLFKEEDVANLDRYNEVVVSSKALPRIVIIIDEFQKLLPSDQRISSATNSKLDNVLRLGRSFGINLILSTQTLKGVDLDPGIMSNIPLRIALNMDEKDAVKIFGDNNKAPKSLEYPGEGIYNANFGDTVANIPFQAYKCIGETTLDMINLNTNFVAENLPPHELDKIYESRFVYNGDQEADIKTNLENINNPKNSNIYIGERAGLTKEHMSYSFDYNTYGENLLIVGSKEEHARSIVFYSIKQMLKNSDNKVYIFNSLIHTQSLFKESFEKCDNFKYVSNLNGLEQFNSLWEEYTNRLKNKEKKHDKIYVYMYFIEGSSVISGNYSDPVQKKIIEIIKNGPELGVHFIIYASDFSTLNEKELTTSLSKFRKKIALQGESGSTKIFGTDVTTTFGNSKHIAIFRNEGKVFKFKPYKIGENNV